MQKLEVANMADFVAEAIFHSAAGIEEDWAALEDAERAQFLSIAHAAIQAHHGFLMSLGFKIVPPGSVAVPSSKDEAAAMVMAVKKFREGDKPGKPKLIMPPGFMH